MIQQKVRSLLILIIASVLGLVFLISAYTKTMPVSYFEFVIDSQLSLGESFSAIAARVLIGLEAAIGLLLIVQLWGAKSWVPKMGLVLTILFSIHLIILWSTVGNDVNCGCMGNQVYLSPVQSLLKNLGLIMGFVILLRLLQLSKNREIIDQKATKEVNGSTTQKTKYNWLTLVITIVLMAIPFFVFPISDKLVLPVSRLSKAEVINPTKPYQGNGKHVIAFMSLGCGHCRDAAAHFASIKRNHPDLPIHLFFSKGADSTRSEKLEDFIQETKADNLDYTFITKDDFLYFMQTTKNEGVPIILWMQDSTFYRQTAVYEINEQELLQWLR